MPTAQELYDAPPPVSPSAAPAARAQSVDLTKLDRTARIVTLCGLLAFVNSFLPWYTVSFEGADLGSANAWDLDYAWITVLLLLGIGIVAVLPAFGLRPVSAVVVAGVGALSAVIAVIRWVTYPDVSGFGASAGAGFATYIAVGLALLVCVVGLQADHAGEGRLTEFLSALKRTS